MHAYFQYSGRLNRKAYWLRTLAIYAVMLVGFSPVLLLGNASMFGEGTIEALVFVAFVIAAVVFIAGFIAVMSLCVRRLHDRNKSGWWLLFFVVFPGLVEAGAAITGNPTLVLIGALINLAISIWFLVEVGFLRGTDGPNRYGPDPLKGTLDAEVFA